MSNAKDMLLPGQGQPMNAPRITMADSQAVECSNCGFDRFMPTYKMRRFSKVLTGESEDSYANIQVMACVNCGQPNYSALPVAVQALFLKELQEEDDETEA